MKPTFFKVPGTVIPTPSQIYIISTNLCPFSLLTILILYPFATQTLYASLCYHTLHMLHIYISILNATDTCPVLFSIPQYSHRFYLYKEGDPKGGQG